MITLQTSLLTLVSLLPCHALDLFSVDIRLPKILSSPVPPSSKNLSWSPIAAGRSPTPLALLSHMQQSDFCRFSSNVFLSPSQWTLHSSKVILGSHLGLPPICLWHSGFWGFTQADFLPACPPSFIPPFVKAQPTFYSDHCCQEQVIPSSHLHLSLKSLLSVPYTAI